MGQPNIKIHTGNRVIVRFQGLVLALLQNVRFNDDYGHEPASGVGDMRPIEHVPSQARHTINAGFMAIRRNNPIAAKIFSENSTTVLEGLIFDIEVFDKLTGNLLRKAVGCSFVSGDIEFQKHAIVLQNAQFLALDMVGTMAAPVLAVDPTLTTVVAAA